MYPKASAIVDKMGYKGHGLGMEEKEIKALINPISYKYNRGLGYTLVPKITIVGAPSDPSFDVKDSDKEEYYKMPFEYQDDIFFNTHINTITPAIPSTPYELQLVHRELIDWDQWEKLALDVCDDNNALMTLLTMHNLEDYKRVHGIQLHENRYFGS